MTWCHVTSHEWPAHRRAPAHGLFLVSQLGEVMVSMASNLMLADERVLWMAQREALACSRIITCLQKIAASRLATPQAFSLVSPSVSAVFTQINQAPTSCSPVNRVL